MTDTDRKITAPVSVHDWYSLIASKSKSSIEDVKAILEKHGIEPHSTTPIRKAIRFNELLFSGTKVGTNNDGDFSFSWSGLGTGLYGVLSEDNLVGKSSVLRLLYGVIRGDFSDVSETVLGWIKHLEARLSIGDVQLALTLVREEDGLKATLTRSNNTTKVDEYSGGISELPEIIDQLLMKELDFHKMFATRESKTLVSHGWPVMASALFVSGSEGAIIGDLMVSGLPQRLLQSFIGLPWISTQSRASAILKIEDAANKSKKNEKNGSSEVIDAVGRLRAELKNLPNTKGAEEERKKNRGRLISIERNIDESIYERSQTKVDVERIAADILVLEKECLKLKQFTLSLEDDVKAGYVFRKLQPVCCPSCESTTFKESASDASGVGQCPLCKEDEPKIEELDDGRISELHEEISAVEKQLSAKMRDYKFQNKKLGSIGSAITSSQNEIEGIRSQKIPDHSTEEIATRRISLEATISELSKLIVAESANEVTPANDIVILKAAVSETKKMYQAKENTLFSDASKLLKGIATKLGVKHLVSVIWTSTSLKIRVANTNTTYSKLSPGEKLRFRIAASVTIAKLAASTGQGRHPGILFFDSPKSEEITDTDFQEIMSAITQIANEDDDLQIFVASRIPSDFNGLSVFKDNKRAVGKDFLF